MRRSERGRRSSHSRSFLAAAAAAAAAVVVGVDVCVGNVPSGCGSWDAAEEGGSAAAAMARSAVSLRAMISNSSSSDATSLPKPSVT